MISFNFKVKASLVRRKELKKFIEIIFRTEKKRVHSVSYIFCDDEFLLKINQEFLKHNYFTDIITFNLTDSKSGNLVGEVYISIDRVNENSSNLKVTFKEEIHRVIIHGILHLCGYKDKSKKEKKLMREKENFYLEKYGI